MQKVYPARKAPSQAASAPALTIHIILFSSQTRQASLHHSLSKKNYKIGFYAKTRSGKKIQTKFCVSWSQCNDGKITGFSVLVLIW